MPNNPKYNKVIYSALKCYREDLEKSMKTITSLYNADIPLTLTDEELRLVKRS
jgi:hypothetical protein